MTIAIPLIAMVVLLVVWALCCPPIEVRARWLRLYVPHARVERITTAANTMTVEFQLFANTANGATTAIEIFAEAWDSATVAEEKVPFPVSPPSDMVIEGSFVPGVGWVDLAEALGLEDDPDG